MTPWYDGLLGKLICYGANREEARGRLVNALDEFSLLGVTNNAAYLRDIIASDQFRDAKLSTHFIDEFFPQDGRSMRAEIDAAIVAARNHRQRFANRQRRAAKLATSERSPWDGLEQLRAVGIAAMKLTRAGDSHEIDVEVISRDGTTIRVRIGDKEIARSSRRMRTVAEFLRLTGGAIRFSARGEKIRSSFQSGRPPSSSSLPKRLRDAARAGSPRRKFSRRCPARCSRCWSATAT